MLLKILIKLFNLGFIRWTSFQSQSAASPLAEWGVEPLRQRGRRPDDLRADQAGVRWRENLRVLLPEVWRRPRLVASQTKGWMPSWPPARISVLRSQWIFSPLVYYPLSSSHIFLPLISSKTGFHVCGLVTRWAQLLMTSYNYLPSPSKDQSTMRADLSLVSGWCQMTLRLHPSSTKPGRCLS